ncbi:MAG: phosphatase PAP2 family protein [Velocimicrobium sp.]
MSYLFFYLVWFFALENRGWVHTQLIHSTLDNLIPFNEFFLIPYLLWFIYIPFVVLFFFFTSKEDYYKTCSYLFIGMTICLIIYTFWPTRQNLRPEVFARDNILITTIKHLYSLDTCTNVCPSIHVFNSIGAHIAIINSRRFKNNRWVKTASFILASSICLSTVFLKQHSIIDGVCAIVLACIMYFFVYYVDYTGIKAWYQERKEKIAYR